MPGIYCILNKVNNKFYIGSTINSFKNRWLSHISSLNKNKHNNSYLQNAWNKYGKDNFEFNIIEEISNTDKDLILEVEQLYLDYTNCLDRTFGYNIALSSSSPNKGRKEPKEVTKKRIESRKNKLVKTNTSGYPNVRLNRGYWNAHITVNKKALHLGNYTTPEEAYLSYLENKDKSIEEILIWKNQQTLNKKTKTSSIYFGVYFCSNRNSSKKWKVNIEYNKKLYQCYFLTELEAAIHYNIYCINNKLNKNLNNLCL